MEIIWAFAEWNLHFQIPLLQCGGRKAFDRCSDWNLRFQISPAQCGRKLYDAFSGRVKCPFSNSPGAVWKESVWRVFRVKPSFSNPSGAVWTEIIWRVFRVKSPLSYFFVVVWTVRHTSKCDSFINFLVKSLEMCSQMFKRLERVLNSIFVMNSYCKEWCSDVENSSVYVGNLMWQSCYFSVICSSFCQGNWRQL